MRWFFRVTMMTHLLRFGARFLRRRSACRHTESDQVPRAQSLPRKEDSMRHREDPIANASSLTSLSRLCAEVAAGNRSFAES